MTTMPTNVTSVMERLHQAVVAANQRLKSAEAHGVPPALVAIMAQMHDMLDALLKSMQKPKA